MTRKLTLKTGVLAAALSTFLLVAACGESQTSGGASAGGSDGTADEVTIGGLWALSGPQAAYGDWFTNGSRLAVEQINSEGGINGETEVALEIEDTQALPEKAVAALQQIMGRQEVPFVLSTFSSQTLALMPIAEANQIAVINIGAQSDVLAEAGDYLFHTLPLLRNETEILSDYLVNEAGFKTAAILYTSDDGGTAARNNYEETFTEQGGDIIAVESGEYGGTDYRSQLTKLRDSGAELLLIGAFGQDTDNIISQAREIGWDVQMANTSWAAIPAVLQNPAAEGLILTSIAFDPAPEFVEAYTEAYGEEPDSPYIANAYDGVMVFAEAYAKASEDDSAVDGADLVEAIQSIKEFPSSYGTPLTFDENGVAQRPIDIAKIQGGAVNVIAERYGS